MTSKTHSPDLTRTILQVLWIGLLIAASFWIAKPFLPSLMWAVMIVVATWPYMLKVQSWLWGKRGLAVSIMTVVMLLTFIIPFSLAIIAIILNADEIGAWVKSLETWVLPQLPGWITGLPLLGSKIKVAWDGILAGPEGLSARLAPYAGMLFTWFLSQIGSVAMIALQFLLTVIISAILYSRGEMASTGIVRFAQRLGGHHGEEIAVLAARTIRSVALGVVGTALIQSFLGGIGLAAAGVPAVSILTAVMFILCIAQLGAGVVLFPAVIWLYYTDQTTWATLLLVWSVLVTTLDNFLRPMLIRMGADLPLVLIFAGVIGGLISFGIVGLFIGPVVLAVTYRLLIVWVKNEEQAPGKELF